MPDTPCIVSLGAYTSVGDSAPASAASVRARINRFAEHPVFVDRAGTPMVTAATPIPGEVTGVERYLTLLTPALEEVLAPVATEALPLVLGIPAPRPGRPEQIADVIPERLRRSVQDGRLARIELVQTGHSAGLMALEAACQRVADGQTGLCLVGGVDTYLEADTLEWLDGTEQLKSGRSRWGFIPGEAAAFCLVASPRAAARLRLPVLAHVLSTATELEPNRIRTDTVCVGQGLTRALRRVLEKLEREVRVEQVIGDLNGERYRTDEYGFTVARLGQRFVDATAIRTPADCWGDVGAASGPLFVALAVSAALRRYAPGPRALVWTSAEGGERGAALLDLTASLRRTP
jgi:3-oxoacyl-[acyl-carrier-protein] synthase-1